MIFTRPNICDTSEGNQGKVFTGGQPQARRLYWKRAKAKAISHIVGITI
jgi:hypothetical protein